MLDTLRGLADGNAVCVEWVDLQGVAAIRLTEEVLQFFNAANLRNLGRNLQHRGFSKVEDAWSHPHFHRHTHANTLSRSRQWWRENQYASEAEVAALCPQAAAAGEEVPAPAAVDEAVAAPEPEPEAATAPPSVPEDTKDLEWSPPLKVRRLSIETDSPGAFAKACSDSKTLAVKAEEASLALSLLQGGDFYCCSAFSVQQPGSDGVDCELLALLGQGYDFVGPADTCAAADTRAAADTAADNSVFMFFSDC